MWGPMKAPCTLRRGKSWPTFAWVATVPAKGPLRNPVAIQRHVCNEHVLCII